MAAATVSGNIFQKCLPSYGTDIKHCGTVTTCDVQTIAADQLDDVFMAAGNYRAMSGIMLYDFEIKSCMTKQNGLYDFIMANKVDMSKKLTTQNIANGRYLLFPFIQALQKSIINNEYWEITAGDVTGIAGVEDWHVTVLSNTGMPADIRWFNTEMRVFINGRSSGGAATRTAWKVIRAVAGAGVVELYLESQNDASYLGTTRAPVAAGSFPTAGLLIRGTPNINDYEEWCEEGPGLNLNKLVPFWIETIRNSLCDSELYRQYRDLIIDDNPYYKMFADVPDVEKNAQLGADWQRRVVNSFFWNKRLSTDQNVNNWRSLPQITTATTDVLDLPNEGLCVGYKANAVGVYEQLAECGRVTDALGTVLNLQELFKALYEISRLRDSIGGVSDTIDAFTDSEYAAKIQQAMVRYFKMKSEDTMRMNVDITKAPTNTKFGFRFNSYVLDWPPIVLNIVSHPYFDDLIAAAKFVAANHEAPNRSLWILDFSGIYPGILTSNRVVNKTGDLQARAAVDASYMCVMKVPSQTQTLTSMTWTIVVECPMSNLLIENLSADVPEHLGVVGALDYTGEYS